MVASKSFKEGLNSVVDVIKLVGLIKQLNLNKGI
jgi:hypothetical protein